MPGHPCPCSEEEWPSWCGGERGAPRMTAAGRPAPRLRQALSPDCRALVLDNGGSSPHPHVHLSINVPISAWRICPTRSAPNSRFGGSRLFWPVDPSSGTSTGMAGAVLGRPSHGLFCPGNAYQSGQTSLDLRPGFLWGHDLRLILSRRGNPVTKVDRGRTPIGHWRISFAMKRPNWCITSGRDANRGVSRRDASDAHRDGWPTRRVWRAADSRPRALASAVEPGGSPGRDAELHGRRAEVVAIFPDERPVPRRFQGYGEHAA